MIKIRIVTTTDIRYSLEISSAQMQFLADVMGCIGGDNRTTRRGIAEEFDHALADSGFRSDYSCPDKNGYIVFTS